MGRSKPLLGYKPQAKTAHIKRVYPADLPPLPPSYEAAVAHRQYQQQLLQQQQQQQYQTAYDDARNRNQNTQQPVHGSLANQDAPAGHNPPIQQPIYNVPATQDTAYYNPPMQHPRYNTPAYQDPACYAPPVQQPTYNAPAAQQRSYANNAPVLDAWGAKLAEEEQHYGGRFFEQNRPMGQSNPNNARAHHSNNSNHANLYNNPNNANAYASSSSNVANAYAARNASRANTTATSRFFNIPPSTPVPGSNGANNSRGLPSTSVALMDVDPDPLFDMNIDDPNAMDLDCIFVTYGGVVYLVHSLGLDAHRPAVNDNGTSNVQPPQQQFLQYRQPQNNDLQHQQQRQQSQRQQRQLFQQQQQQQHIQQQQLRLQQQQLRPQQQQRLQQQNRPQQQQQYQQQHQQQQQSRSRHLGQTRVISQTIQSRLAQPIPSITSTNITTQPASNVAFTTGHTILRRNVERVAERFRGLQLTEAAISSYNLDESFTEAGGQHAIRQGSTAAAASGSNTTAEGKLVSFSSDDLVNLGSPRPSVLSASGVWEDLAALQNAFIPPSPLVDDSLLVQVPLSSSPYSTSSSSGSSEYSQYFDLREIDWSRSSTSSPPMYREHFLSGSANKRLSACFSKSAQWTPLSKKLQAMSNVTRRCRTKKQKKIIVLGLPKDTLQQTRRKNKSSTSSSARTVKPKKKKAVLKTVTVTPPSVVVDKPAVSTEQQPKTTRAAYSSLYVPKRSAIPATTPVASYTKVMLPRRVVAASIAPPSPRTAAENRRPRKTVTFADDVAPDTAPKAAPKATTPAPAVPNAQPLLPSLPITPVGEPRVSRYNSYSYFYNKASYVAPVPSARTVEKPYPIRWCRDEPASERATPATPLAARSRGEREYASKNLSFSKVPVEKNVKGLSGEKTSSETVPAPQAVKRDEKVFPGAFPEEPEANGPTLFSWLRQKVLRW